MFWKVVAMSAASVALAAGSPAAAEEGMWPFDDAPLAQVKSALGVSLNRAWLDHLRDASVRLTNGCSASVVSASGLALTNQHCVIGCAQEVSPPDHDYVAEGFVAGGQADERACPGLQAEVLTAIVDVTDKIYAAGAGKSGAQYVAARSAAIADAEHAACGGDPKFRCQVYSFYDGGQFKAYRYRKYADVRLVFAPELEAAWFGGDPDNFTFPRYDLDCAFVRLYEDGRAARTPAHLVWSNAAPVDGEPVFVAGAPGATERRLTVSELQSLRDVALPQLAAEEAELKKRLLALGAQSPRMRRRISSALFEAENTEKLLDGRLAALRDTSFMDSRLKEEASLRARLAADKTLAPQIGDPWTELEAVQKDYALQFAVWRQLESAAGEGSELFRYARTLVRAAAERAKPPGERLPEYLDSHLTLQQKALLDDRPIEPALETLELTFWLERTQALLGPGSAAVQMLLGGETPGGLASRLVAGSRLGDRDYREALWAGGMTAIAASQDPLIQFVLRTDPLSRAARQVWEQEVLGPQQDAGERLERVRFAIEGPGLYPDANFSLRLSFGRVAGLQEPGAGWTSPFTTFGGLFERATGAPPYRLPGRWTAQAAKLDQAQVLDFATTDDITGGNSGSPVVDAQGRIIGTAFDGNSHSLAGEFAYDGSLNRTVAVSTGAITQALAQIYGDAPLAGELAAQ